MAWLTLVVEGTVDQAVATTLVALHGHEVAASYVTEGKSRLDRNLPGYNNAARFAPWLVIRDLNRDAPCASALINVICPDPAAYLTIRIAVREIEAWLLADRESIARFLGVRMAEVPSVPDTVQDPKGAIVTLARRSRYRAIRRDLVPAVGVSASVGPAYTRRMIQFATERWRPDRAAEVSDSLRRCREALSHL